MREENGKETDRMQGENGKEKSKLIEKAQHLVRKRKYLERGWMKVRMMARRIVEGRTLQFCLKRGTENKDGG